MPPWKPVAGSAHFRDDRSLTAAERDLLLRWIAAGAPEGDRSQIPPPPRWPTGWQLGQPDVVVTLPAPYAVDADGPDVYRNFVIPSPVGETRYVAAWEFRAGSRTIHHAILNIDRMGIARRRDAEDAAPGYEGMGDQSTQSPDGFYLVWTPGQVPTPPEEGASWRLDARTDLVLQLHLHPTGRAEAVRPSLGLYFAPAPPRLQRLTFRIGDRPIDIAPGNPHWVMTDHATLPVDVVMHSLFPHAHYLGRRMRAWATLPDGQSLGLLRIDDWDPAWQDAYVLDPPIALPRGTTLHMEFVYDNSEANERNPNQPPRRVRDGEQSTDEMGNVTLSLSPRDPTEFVALQEFKFRRAPEGPESDYNLANVLMRRGRIDEAISRYRRATTRRADFDAAWYNLGIALAARGDQDGAAAAYRAALRVRPEHAAARINLGHILMGQGRLPEALREFRAAVAAEARAPTAHNSLGVALLRSGDPAGAVSAFRAAQALEPDNHLSHFELGNALRAMGDVTAARSAFRRALALSPGFAPARAALAALDAADASVTGTR